MALELEAGNSFWKQYAADEEKRQADAGIQTINLDGDKAKVFVDTAYSVAWAAAIKASPVHAAKLKSLLGNR